MTLNDILKEVRIVLDENELSTPLTTFGDTDQLQTDDILKSCLKRAMRLVYNNAPLWSLTKIIKKEKGTVTNRYNAYSIDNGSMFTLPVDILRPIAFMCKDWKQPVTEFLDRSDDRYKHQACDFAGVRGTGSRPLVFVVNDPTLDNGGKGYLEIYSTSTATNDCYITYIPEPSISGESIDVPDSLFDALIYTTASLYLTTLGKFDAAKVFEDIAKGKFMNLQNPNEE